MRKILLMIFLLIPFFVKGEEPLAVDVFLLIDQSGSMKESDPNNIRISAAQYFIDLLSQDYSPSLPHRLGVINFGDKPPQTIPLTPLSDSGSLKSNLKPMDLGNTSFISALREAEANFSRDQRKQRRVVIILTDGEPDDARKLSKDAYFREIENFVQSKLRDTLIYVILVDVKDRFWRKDKPYWDKITGGKVYLLRSMDEEQLQKVYTDIGSNLMRAEAPKWDIVPPEGKEVEVEPYLEKITFVILKKDKDTPVEIVMPSGRPLSEREDNVKHTPPTKGFNIWREIYTVMMPQPGKWKYKLGGQGKVEIGRTPLPIEMKLVSPAGKPLGVSLSPDGKVIRSFLYPQGKPIWVIASFLKRDGSAVEEIPGYRLYLGAILQTPTGKSYHIDLLETRSKGVFQGSQVVETREEGEYKLIPQVKGGDKDISPSVIYLFRVKPIPYVEVKEPTSDKSYHPLDNIPVKAAILVAGKPVSPGQWFSDSPNSLLWAQLKRGSELLPISVHLEYNDEENIFIGFLKAPKETGDYILSFHLSGHLLTGEEYLSEPTEDVALFIRYSLLSFLKVWLWVIPIIAGLAILYIGIRWWRQPELSGRIEWTYISSSGAVERGEATLQGRIMRMGGGNKDDIRPVPSWPKETWCEFTARFCKEGKICVKASYYPNLARGRKNRIDKYLSQSGDSFSIRNDSEEIIITYFIG